ncbi:MAG: DUF4398 domain-containing protein [Epsilonproteobacteria bacterium]|nr:DUF4398 domain-containing protein [Campylobacterota bacterium]
MLKISNKIFKGCMFGLTALILLGGCASKNPPTDKILSAESAISRASENKAEIYDPLNLKIAKEKLQKAKELMKEKKYEEASMLAEEAEVDAQLAEEKSRTKETKKIADEILDSINALKEEIERLRK